MTNVTLKCGCCFIIPLSVLRKLAQAEQTVTADRGRYQRCYAVTQKLRLVREGHRQASLAGHQSGLALRATAVAKVPVEHLFDCKHATTLPGTAVPTAARSGLQDRFRYDGEGRGVLQDGAGTQLGRQPGHGPGVEPEL